MTRITDKVSSNSCTGATSLVEAANKIHYGDEPSFETFGHFAGIEDTILTAIAAVAQNSFGPRFKEVSNYGNPLVITVGPSEKGVLLRTEYQIAYRGFFTDFLADPEVFCRVFAEMQAQIHKIVKAKYPEAGRIFLQHRYQDKRRLKLILNVMLAPRMLVSPIPIRAAKAVVIDDTEPETHARAA